MQYTVPLFYLDIFLCSELIFINAHINADEAKEVSDLRITELS
jgi:hypothetical protein